MKFEFEDEELQKRYEQNLARLEKMLPSDQAVREWGDRNRWAVWLWWLAIWAWGFYFLNPNG